MLKIEADMLLPPAIDAFQNVATSKGRRSRRRNVGCRNVSRYVPVKDPRAVNAEMWSSLYPSLIYTQSFSLSL